MVDARGHKVSKISSKISITAQPEIIWENIVNVKIEAFSHPFWFKLLGIPKPMKADLVSIGVGGHRIAYFENGKKFMQMVTSWHPFREYSFDFNPENGFVVGHFFDISDGMFRVCDGSYLLTEKTGACNLQLFTTYSINNRVSFLLNIPIRIVLKAFQYYLLRSIKINCEQNESNKVC